jgi:hypothetical protein
MSEKERWDGLLQFLPALQNREPLYWRVGTWGDMPSVVSTDTARRLLTYLHENIVLPDFDWQAWQDQAIGYLDYRIRLETADLPTLRKLLTAHVRADRFAEGHYDSILENGFLRDVLERVAVLSEVLEK